jgi:hypothetical protein
MLSKSTQIKVALYFCAVIVLHGDVLWRARHAIREGLPDFSGAYTAGLILRDGHGDRLYDDVLQESLQRSFSPIAVEKRGTILPYIHLPFEALLYLPLAHFSYVTAYSIWLAVNLVLLCSIPFLLRGRLRVLGKTPVLLWLLAGFAYFPIFSALIQGQDSILLLFLYCIAWRALERAREFAAGSWLALGLYKYHLVLPSVLTFYRRMKLVAGFVSVAAILGLISLAITGWTSLLAYPRYVWRTEHDMKYAFNSLPGLTANLRGIISAIVPSGHPQVELGLVAFFSVVVLITMIRAGGRLFSPGSEGQRALLALSLVGTALLSYHMYVHDLTVLFLAIVLVVEMLLGDIPMASWTRKALWICVAILYFSPLYELLSLRYRQLQLMAIVLIVFFGALLSLVNSLAERTDGSVSPQASAGR